MEAPKPEEKAVVTEQPERAVKIFVILNPVAGHASAEEIRQELEAHSQEHGWEYEIYETTGDEDVSKITRQACKQGATIVMAAGGDGTVSGVVNGLIGSNVPLAILPVGTGNGLARALSIPLKPRDAIHLLAEGYEVMDVDAMQVGDRYFVLNVSAGISPRAMRDTDTDLKRRFGILAYAWTILQLTLHNPPRPYKVTMDGRSSQVRAVEILASNSALFKDGSFSLSDRESINDSAFDVYIVTAQDLRDYMRLAWGLLRDPTPHKRELRSVNVKEYLKIESLRNPQPVQADGEVIGHTPVEVRVAPDAIRVIVPVQKDEAKA
jgi:YegS/Rv2252/BmrU family lipid kinase